MTNQRNLQFETTDSQQRDTGLPGSTASALPAFLPAAAGTYELYRRISAHPTNALARGIVYGPIVAGSWRWARRSNDVPTAWATFISETLNPLRQRLLCDGLKALEFGWAGFEKIWTLRDGRMVIDRLKPLLWDYTSILADEHGNVRGLCNQPAGKPAVNLLEGKYFLYCHDGEAGNPYGRSRHENIRQTWSESEQIRQRLAQYMRKVAGIVVQLHYPEGTSRDAAGADRPNQWLAQQVLDAVSSGKSVMFPNGFASSSDLRMAYELAGKSQWQLSSFDPGGADHAAGMRAVLEYYDALIFRGWLRPERTGLEAQHGSKADAVAHTDTATLDCQLIDRDFADAVNRGVVDDMLAANFGQAARGAVYIDPAPIADDQVQVLQAIMAAAMGNGDMASTLLGRIDVGQVLRQLGIPQNTI